MINFEEIKITDLKTKPFELKHKWMLITAQKDGKVNTMTASWGGFGVMWNKDVVFVVIRPQRYTKEFVDASDSFSLTFFDDTYKKQLSYLGKTSGKYENKLDNVDLKLAYSDNIPYFNEANMVVTAKKLYAQPMGSDFFIEKEIIDKWYPESDFHILYVAEITKILVRP